MKYFVVTLGILLTLASALKSEKSEFEYNLKAEISGLNSDNPREYLQNSDNWIYGLSDDGLPVYRQSFETISGNSLKIDSIEIRSLDSIGYLSSQDIIYYDISTDAESVTDLYGTLETSWLDYNGTKASLEYRYNASGKDYYFIYLKSLIFRDNSLIIISDVRVYISSDYESESNLFTASSGSYMQATLESISGNDSFHRDKTRSALLSSSYFDNPNYLIITTEELAPCFKPFLLWKRALGFKAEIKTVEDIESGYSGIDQAEQIREFLKDAYLNGLEWLLIGGDETIVPVRKFYAANTNEPVANQYLHPSDLYYGDLTGEWDVDGDGVWGEPYHDNPDLQPEIFVGRIPAATAEAVSNWIEKTIAYENGTVLSDPDYVGKAMITSADQMRDWNNGQGQDSLIAGFFPQDISPELSSMAEYPSGGAQNPSNPPAKSFIEEYSEGWNLAVILAHGVEQGFVSMSSNYNEWPKTYVWTGSGTDSEVGYLDSLTNYNKAGIVYSVACSQGAFDRSNSAGSCFAEYMLTLEGRGAAAFIGYTRYGWVASSYLLAEKFVDALYNNDNRLGPANTISKLFHSNYRDLNYGLNLFGDPSLAVWTETPGTLTMDHPKVISLGENDFILQIQSGGQNIDNALITVINNDEVLFTGVTGLDGTIELVFDSGLDSGVIVTASKDDYKPIQVSLSTSIILDADDDIEDNSLPQVFELYQNFPNPANPGTTISFSLPENSDIELEVYNILGQKVSGYSENELSSGYHEIEIDLSGYSSGVYFYRLSAGEFSDCRKLMLLK